MRFVLLFILAFYSLPGFTTEEDDKLTDELHNIRKKHAEQAVMIDKTRQNLQDSTLNIADQIKGLGHKTIDSAALLDDKVQALLQKALAESQIRSQSPVFIRAMILGKIAGKPYEKFLLRFPVLIDIMVDVIKDKDALPGLLRILSRQDDLKMYFYVWVGLLILGFILKKIFFPKIMSAWKKFCGGILLSFSLTSISLGFFYYLFSTEIHPTVKIIGHHIF